MHVSAWVKAIRVNTGKDQKNWDYRHLWAVARNWILEEPKSILSLFVYIPNAVFPLPLPPGKAFTISPGAVDLVAWFGTSTENSVWRPLNWKAFFLFLSFFVFFFPLCLFVGFSHWHIRQSYLFIFRSNFIWMNASPTCNMYTRWTPGTYPWRPEESIRSPGIGVRMVVSYPVGCGNWIWVLCKSSKCSKQLRYLFSP